MNFWRRPARTYRLIKCEIKEKMAVKQFWNMENMLKWYGRVSYEGNGLSE
jgi:hypothetical protein